MPKMKQKEPQDRKQFLRHYRFLSQRSCRLSRHRRQLSPFAAALRLRCAQPPNFKGSVALQVALSKSALSQGGVAVACRATVGESELLSGVSTYDPI